MPTLSLLRKQQMLYCQFTTYLVHAHFRTCWKYNRNEFHASIVDNLLGRQLLEKPFSSKFSIDEKQVLS